jgi:hypothetical protein
MATFDGTPFSPIKVHENEVEFEINETTLLSGKNSIQVNSEQKFARTYECFTEDYSEISNLLAKIGTAGTLAVDSNSYDNCYISTPFSYKEVIMGSGKYTYTITFKRDTT